MASLADMIVEAILEEMGDDRERFEAELSKSREGDEPARKALERLDSEYVKRVEAARAA